MALPPISNQELASRRKSRQETAPMRLRPALSLPLLLGVLAVAAPAHAQQAATGFIQQKHALLEQILHQPDSPARDAQVNQALDSFVDYDEMTRRTFGAPCHPSITNCEDLWSQQLSDAQHAEVTDLLKQLIRKNYRKNLLKTLDYNITYKGERTQGGDIRVITEAQNTQKPRDPAVRVDYIVKQTGNGFICADFVTEGSSLTKNYYDQFKKKMHNPGEGYPNITAKLREKIAKKD
jgi:ABC-type transporter MlaC component